jgi:hypothetical protein
VSMIIVLLSWHMTKLTLLTSVADWYVVVIHHFWKSSRLRRKMSFFV